MNSTLPGGRRLRWNMRSWQPWLFLVALVALLSYPLIFRAPHQIHRPALLCPAFLVLRHIANFDFWGDGIGKDL